MKQDCIHSATKFGLFRYKTVFWIYLVTSMHYAKTLTFQRSHQAGHSKEVKHTVTHRFRCVPVVNLNGLPLSGVEKRAVLNAGEKKIRVCLYRTISRRKPAKYCEIFLHFVDKPISQRYVENILCKKMLHFPPPPL
jgi:hypothetical protein